MKVGDTITTVDNPEKPIEGFENVKPMVFVDLSLDTDVMRSLEAHGKIKIK